MRHNENTQSAAIATDWPEFVKVVDADTRQLHFWIPDRTGIPDVDRAMGAGYFAEALEFSAEPSRSYFLAHVLVNMFGFFGHTEHGFIEALLRKARFGAMPPRLTDAEAEAIEGEPEAVANLRSIEAAMAGALECRIWAADAPYVVAVCILTGRDGPHIGGAATMLARKAFNASRH